MKREVSVMLNYEYLIYSLLNIQTYFYFSFLGGYREEAIPSPIPNLEVKSLIADNTADCICGNVGRRQVREFDSFFLLIIYPIYYICHTFFNHTFLIVLISSIKLIMLVMLILLIISTIYIIFIVFLISGLANL